MSTAGAAGALARAFADDPFWTWVIPAPDGRVERLTHIFGALLRVRAAAGDQVFTDPAIRSALLCSPPGSPRGDLAEIVRLAPAMLSGAGTGVLRLLRASRVFEAERPVNPHAYVAIVGTVPEARGLGLAGSLLDRAFALADAAGALTWLETESAANVPYYERRGFVVRRERELGSGGPRVYFMAREPRGLASAHPREETP